MLAVPTSDICLEWVRRGWHGDRLPSLQASSQTLYVAPASPTDSEDGSGSARAHSDLMLP